MFCIGLASYPRCVRPLAPDITVFLYSQDSVSSIHCSHDNIPASCLFFQDCVFIVPCSHVVCFPALCPVFLPLAQDSNNWRLPTKQTVEFTGWKQVAYTNLSLYHSNSLYLQQFYHLPLINVIEMVGARIINAKPD